MDAVTIPIHGGSEIGPPLFHKLIALSGVTSNRSGARPQNALPADVPADWKAARAFTESVVSQNAV